MHGTGTTDRVIDAFRVLLATRVNAELSAGWAEPGATFPAIESTIGRPLARQWLGNERLPLLAVYRRSTSFASRGARWDRSASIGVDVYGPLTSHDRIDERWPMMHAIAESIVSALDGKIGEVDVLDAAGVREVVESSITWSTTIAVSQGSEAYPVLSMRFDVVHRPDGLPISALTDGLPLLGDLCARYLSVEKPPEDPIVVEACSSVDGGARATLAASDPFDDEHEAFP